MESGIRTHWVNWRSADKHLQNAAYNALIAATDRPVDWAYEVWDGLVNDLRDKDNHVRAIAAQLLCNLAKSDPEGRMLKDFPALLSVTRDERFVTARHCLQNLWKVGAAGVAQQAMLLDGLRLRFEECSAEKNCTLIRYDIAVTLRRLYDLRLDESIRAVALALIDTEADAKYRKKYAGAWK
jgi:hypothetical protein